MISHSKKFIFIHIPRTGGTSIENALIKYSEGELNSGGAGRWFPDRVLEMYILKILGKEKLENAKHLTALDWKKILGSRYDNYYKFNIIRNPLNKIESFNNFDTRLDVTESMDKWKWNQSMFFEDENGNNIVDNIFKFENLEESWKIICNVLKLENTFLPHYNNSNIIPKDGTNFNKKQLDSLKILLKDELKKLKYE